MKSINKTLTALVASLFLMASCSLLEVENTSQIYGSSYWNSTSEVESYLIGTYTQFRTTLNTLEYFDSRSDEFVSGLEGGTSDSWAQNLSSSNGISWANFYTVVQHCNMILKYSDDVNFTLQSQKDNILAQAYALRAYSFFCLVRLWGDVPLELKPTESSTKEKLGRSPASEVLDQAIADTKKAIELFTDEWGNGKSYATKHACYAMMSDMLLWKAKVLGGDRTLYDKVIEYADLAMEGTSLEEDFTDIFSTRNGKEIIWSIHFGYPEASRQYGAQLKPRDIFVASAVNAEKIAYAKSGARSQYAPSDEMKALFTAYSGDVRKDNSYIVAVDAGGNVLGTFDNKMRGTKVETNFIYDNDIILYRTAEMILFKAEAYAAQDKIDDAITELNKVRSRAKIAPWLGAKDKVTVGQAILAERGREFWIECKRWPDLLRFHFDGIIDIYQEVPNLKKKADNGIKIPLYFAITRSELSLNHKLTQTIGYENL